MSVKLSHKISSFLVLLATVLASTVLSAPVHAATIMPAPMPPAIVQLRSYTKGVAVFSGTNIAALPKTARLSPRTSGAQLLVTRLLWRPCSYGYCVSISLANFSAITFVATPFGAKYSSDLPWVFTTTTMGYTRNITGTVFNGNNVESYNQTAGCQSNIDVRVKTVSNNSWQTLNSSCFKSPNDNTYIRVWIPEMSGIRNMNVTNWYVSANTYSLTVYPRNQTVMNQWYAWRSLFYPKAQLFTRR